ncbi:Gfo/Idh/MocA family oxidoreductase [bacterium]|nr:Gfo/Idh/MocA family oxidoreductase [bacterium]
MARANHTDNRIRLGLLGFGYWGPNLARVVSEIKDAVLAYIIDAKEENRQRAKARYPNAIVSGDIEIALKDPDVQGILIATPAKTHYELAKLSLEAGKDVFVEKPLALSYKEGQELVNLAKAKDRILMVGHLMLYHPAVLKMKEMLDKGELGSLFYLFFQRLSLGRVRSDENVLWSLAPHDISMLLFLCQETPSDIWARGGCFLQENIEDIVMVHIRFPSGVMADIQVSWLAPHKLRQVLLVGDKKMLIFDDVESFEKLKVYEHSIDANSFFLAPPFIPRYGDIHSPYLPQVEPLKEECLEFVRCIKTRQAPRTDGEEGLKVLQVLEAAQDSLKKGGF